jgi:molecular chaperone GrpE (heat shock protein)
MTDSESAQDRAPTTEQIAAAGNTDGKDRTSPGQHPLADIKTEQPASATKTAADSDPGMGDQPHAQLLADDELQSILAQWKDIQAEFVDEPRRAVQEADTLVADLMQRLARMFASERDQLESRWASGDDVSTEELRHGLRRYRSFFERLLAA